MAGNSGGMPEGVKTTLGWAVGIAAIALVFVITLILFGNLSGNGGFKDTVTNIGVTNQTITWVNNTGFTLSGYNSSWSSITLVSSYNSSSNIGFGIGNISVSATGVITNATNTVWQGADSVKLSYSYKYTHTSNVENQFESAIGNYSQSAVNTTAQFPTVGTILGVAILLTILIGVLIFAIRKMMGITSGVGGKVVDNGGFG